jgi:FkbH-like protein
MIANKVKLVVWDLDDTFWSGTLLEGGIVPVARNIDMVKELSQRGILNSICSKNDYEQVKAKLTELAVWEHFVFSHIDFSPKGQAIAAMLEAAALRAENVLFIDDNRSNIEEVKYFNPGIMTAHPNEVLEDLLEHPHCAGKPDPEFIRLKQYQFLQKKAEEKKSSTVSNEEFLRLSNIRVRIDYDVEANFDRVVELINRTNQLNYTKRRLEDPSLVRKFRESLNGFGHNSGCVWVSDNFGDYGLAGFFMMKRRASFKKLIHFVFSCRTMNMGIEQYVYELLGKPEIEIAPAVSYGLDIHAAIDWINAGTEPGANASKKAGGSLLLLGGCDLLQLANYCSTNRLEFANMAKGDVTVRFDEPGFILNNREALRENSRYLPTWSYEDALRFDEGIATSDLILLCMFGALQGSYYQLNGALTVRLASNLLSAGDPADPDALRNRVQPLDWDQDRRTQLVMECFDIVDRRAKADAQIFVISPSSLAAKNEKKAAKRKAFNTVCEDYCATHRRFRFIDVDKLIPREELIDARHFSPAGYFSLARHILGTAGIAGPALDAPAMPAAKVRTASSQAEPALAL